MQESIIMGRTRPDTLPRIWNFFSSEKDARQYAIDNRDILAKEYPAGYTVAPYSDYVNLVREHYAKSPLTEITSGRFWEMLECLPPMRWEHADGVERFMVSEAEQGTYHAQFAQWKDRFFTRTVDACDRSTWITGAQCAAVAQRD